MPPLRRRWVAVKSVSKSRRRFADRRLAGLEHAAPVGRRKDLGPGGGGAGSADPVGRREHRPVPGGGAKIVLRCAEGGTHKQAAADPGTDESPVERWRDRFIAGRLEGLHDEPRPGRQPSILLDRAEDLVVATLDATPGKDTYWSRASMATRTGLSKSTIGRIWKKFDLKPHLQGSFKLSAAPFFVEKSSISPAPRHRVPQGPRHDRQGRARRPGRTLGLRQLRHPQHR
jgi:Homeodomain-like domain